MDKLLKCSKYPVDREMERERGEGKEKKKVIDKGEGC
jgi:hypothetical protein